MAHVLAKTISACYLGAIANANAVGVAKTHTPHHRHKHGHKVHAHGEAMTESSTDDAEIVQSSAGVGRGWPTLFAKATHASQHSRSGHSSHARQHLLEATHASQHSRSGHSSHARQHLLEGNKDFHAATDASQHSRRGRRRHLKEGEKDGEGTDDFHHSRSDHSRRARQHPHEGEEDRQVTEAVRHGNHGHWSHLGKHLPKHLREGKKDGQVNLVSVPDIGSDSAEPLAEHFGQTVAVRQFVVRADSDLTSQKRPSWSPSTPKKIQQLLEAHEPFGFRRLARHSLTKAGSPSTETHEFEVFMRFFDGRCSTQSFKTIPDTWAASGTGKMSSCLAPSQSSPQVVSFAQEAVDDRRRQLAVHRKTLAQPQRWVVSAEERTEDATSTVTKLDWPGFQKIMNGFMSMNGFKTREAAYLKEHPMQRAVSLVDRFNIAVNMKDAEAMKGIIQFAVESLGGAVTDQDTLDIFARTRLTLGKDFKAMTKKLAEVGNSGQRWVRFGGEYAALNEVGYAALLKYEDTGVIEPFVKRVITNLDMKVTNTEGLKSFVRFYNKECGTASFDKLKQELFISANETKFCGGGWLQKV